MIGGRAIWVVLGLLFGLASFIAIPFLILRSSDDSNDAATRAPTNASTTRRVNTRTTVTTTTRTTATTTTTATTLDTSRYLPLGCSNSNVFGVFNTVAGGNSTAATPGLSIGNYPSAESPPMGCDGNTNTKSLSFGNCGQSNSQLGCGTNTGFYVTPPGNASVVIGFRLCAANDLPARDPMNVTLEGSNQSGTDLTLGSSWSLLYQGSSGLETDPGRISCGLRMLFSNSLAFSSYRFLVTAKRGVENSVQFSEFQLIIP